MSVTLLALMRGIIGAVVVGHGLSVISPILLAGKGERRGVSHGPEGGLTEEFGEIAREVNASSVVIPRIITVRPREHTVEAVEEVEQTLRHNHVVVEGE